MSKQQQHLYEFGPFSLDTTDRFLLRDGQPVLLPPKALETLIVLVQHRGRLVEKDELMKTLWPDSFVEEANLNHHVWILRKTLGDTSGGLGYIETVPRRGYRFIANVTEPPNGDDELVVEKHSFTRIVTEEAEDKETGLIGNTNPGRRLDVLKVVVDEEERDAGTSDVFGKLRKHKLGVAATALSVLVLAAVGLGYWFFNGRAANSRQITSVAVLPFLNESGDPNSEYLSDGISESLINSLSQLSQLKVIARSSSFKYKGNAVDPLKVANALGVQGIVTGRIVQRGDNVLISVELMDARDKTQVWGEQFNRRGSDLLAVQAEISREIARKLRLRLTAGEQQQLTKISRVHPQAYDLLIRGRFYLRKGGPENQKKAVDYFNQAIGVDPTYALAYAELAATYEVLYAGGWLDPKEFKPRAEAAAQRALELDDGLADAHYALANLRRNAWDWAAAEQEYQRAIELNPNLAEAHAFYSYYLMVRGRHDQAIAEAKRARELDPLSLIKNTQVGNALAVARRYDAAIESLKMTLQMDQSYAQVHWCLGYIYTAKGMYAEGISEYQENIRLGDDGASGQIYLGAAYAKAGERGKAQQILKRLQTTSEYVSSTELSILYAALGEREQAFASLEKAYAAHDLQLQSLNADASFDSLRDDPRFQDILRRAGLPQ